MELKKWLAALSIALFSHIVHAVYPDRPIKIVVAFAPGSSTDIVARNIGQNLSIALGQPVIIEISRVPAEILARLWLPNQQQMAIPFSCFN